MVKCYTEEVGSYMVDQGMNLGPDGLRFMPVVQVYVQNPDRRDN